MNGPQTFVLPTRPYSIVDALNRRSLATGGVRAAQLGGHADYNGHAVRVWFNDFRGHWVADYTWAGPVVLARGTLEACLAAAAREYARGALGASAEVIIASEHDAALARAAGFIPADQEDRSWMDWKFEELNSAMMFDKHGMPRTHHLIAATSREDYEARIANPNRGNAIEACLTADTVPVVSPQRNLL